MGEGWAARNAFPSCQELLARVGAWAGRCLLTQRLLSSLLGLSQGRPEGSTATLAEAP